MALRLQHGFSSFVAFYSCSRTSNTRNCRHYSLYTSRCLSKSRTHSQPARSVPKRYLHATAPCRATQKDPYQVLGVSRDASPAEIKKTYFALARKYHPDTNPDKGARDKFVEIQDAYDILKDEKKKAAYDAYGHSSQMPGFDPNAFGAGGGQPFSGGFSGGFAGGFPFGFQAGGRSGASHGDLFEDLFGAFGGRTSRGGRQAPQRGEDVRADLTISFLEACKGTKKKVTITPIIDCSTCSGSGLKAGVDRATCGSCGGTGTRTFVLDNGFQMASTCNDCGGEGSKIPRGGSCNSCDGLGKVRTKKTVDVSIPPGADDGMVLAVSGQGDAPLAGKGSKGDLLVRLHVTRSPVFSRQGANLYYQAKVPFHRALLGGIVRVPTLDAEVDVRVPQGTQPGEEMVLKGRGVPYPVGTGVGDLFVKFTLQMPRSLTPKQRALLEEYAADVEGRSGPSGGNKSGGEESKTEGGATTSDGEQQGAGLLSRGWDALWKRLGY